ncbi:hypothetical protein [Streptomyces sp. NRRL F-5126]|uniref:hypothetical protein n=1 Tax=Streptomyces sp. NRRL F-5126 TaxID=1463857 RepID=UPI000AB4C2BA|nr:hypothetical protein [Streptomyces sp. NRRL F-5126]
MADATYPLTQTRDIAEAERRGNDHGGAGMTHESFMAELEAEDLRGRTTAW